jgi:adenosylcobinamide-GDP ribazoletransferase
MAFLTTLPTPLLGEAREDDARRAVSAYPLVGLVLGVLLWGAAAAVDTLLPGFPPPLRGALLTALGLALTGALHFDGLCDTADAAFSSTTVEERRRIASDPAIGSFGVAAGGLLLVVKSAALAAVAPSALLVVPVVSRTAAALPMAWSRTHPGSRLATRARPTAARALAALLGGISLILGLAAVTGSVALWSLLLVTSLLLALAGVRWLSSRLDGIGGDGYGAIIEVSEALLLILLAAT